jgi:succinate-acetate transporter protein
MASVSEQPLRAEPAAEKGANWAPPNPAPLGLGGFGATTLALSLINANLISGKDVPMVLGLAFAYGGLAQLLAGMWEFRTGNPFGAIAFSSYGAFWISYFFLVNFDVAKIPATNAGGAVSAWLWIWGLISLVFTLCTLKAPSVLTLLFTLLTAVFVILALGAGLPSTAVTKIGGFVGIVLAANALYLMLAFLAEGVYGRAILPVGSPLIKS